MLAQVQIPQHGLQIIFVRHGEVHNPEQIFYGRLPRFKLNTRGREQAQAAAHALAPLPLAAIAHSPLLRARQTAQILAAAHPGVSLQQSRWLLEVRTSHQGLPTAALDAIAWNFYEPQLHEDDETIADVAARITAFSRRMLRRYRGQVIAAVTHGDVLAIARAYFAGWPLSLASLRGEHYPATASLLRVTLSPDLQASDVAYLQPWSEQTLAEAGGGL